MKCIVPNRNLNTLSRCFHTLAKLGDSVFIEIHQTHMLIQAVSPSQSAFGCFKLDEDFYTAYISGETTIKCKISLKSCFHAFKSLNPEKSVEECHFEAEEGSDELVVRFHCKHDVIKTFKLPFIDLELLNANFSKEKCKSEIISPSKVLQECVQSFLSTVEEVTFKVTNDKVIVKNYTEDEPDQTKIVHTEKRLEIDEFISYKVNEDADLTFCLKELKAVLSFADGAKLNLPIHINFNKSGDALIFSIKSDQGWDACFVLATLSDGDKGSSQYESTPNSTETENVGKVEANKKKQNSKKPKENPEPIANGRLSSSQNENIATSTKPRCIIDLTDSEEDDNPTQPLNLKPEPPEEVPVEEDDFDEVIPASPPPAKRFKHIFLAKPKGCKYTSQLEPNPIILAPDSEEDDSNETI